jgi:hypothetical protein
LSGSIVILRCCRSGLLWSVVHRSSRSRLLLVNVLLHIIFQQYILFSDNC